MRVNVVNPDAIFGTGLWSLEIREQRARAHGIDPAQMEEFYRKRNLLGVEVRSEDVAEAVLFLASDRSSRTTSAMIARRRRHPRRLRAVSGRAGFDMALPDNPLHESAITPARGHARRAPGYWSQLNCSGMMSWSVGDLVGGMCYPESS